MGFSEGSAKSALRGMGSGLGVISPVTVTAALKVGSVIGSALGIDAARFRSPEENFQLRQQLVDQTLARALQQDQAAVLQLWLWTGIPNDGNHLPTRAARDYAVAALRRYYAQSGADALPSEWMAALNSPSPQTRMNAIPPVPSEFEGSASGGGINLGGMGGTGGLLALAVGAAVVFLASRTRGRR